MLFKGIIPDSRTELYAEGGLLGDFLVLNWSGLKRSSPLWVKAGLNVIATYDIYQSIFPRALISAPRCFRCRHNCKRNPPLPKEAVIVTFNDRLTCQETTSCKHTSDVFVSVVA